MCHDWVAEAVEEPGCCAAAGLEWNHSSSASISVAELGQRRGPTTETVHLQFSGHDLQLDFRFATTGERYFLAQRHIPLQSLMIAVRQILPVWQCHHQVAAGSKALERSLRGRIRRQRMIRDDGRRSSPAA